MSILSELKKLTGKQNAKVVSEALPDSAGSGSGNDFEIVITDNGPGSDPQLSINVTPLQVYNAVLGGKRLIVRINRAIGVCFVENVKYGAGNFGFCLTELTSVRNGVTLVPVAQFEQFDFTATDETTYAIEYSTKIVNVNDLP
jgi:hypothetical protein